MIVKQLFKIISPRLFNDNFGHAIEVEFKNSTYYIEEYDEYDTNTFKHLLLTFPKKDKSVGDYFKIEQFENLEVLNLKDMILSVFTEL